MFPKHLTLNGHHINHSVSWILVIITVSAKCDLIGVALSLYSSPHHDHTSSRGLPESPLSHITFNHEALACYAFIPPFSFISQGNHSLQLQLGHIPRYVS